MTTPRPRPEPVPPGPGQESVWDYPRPPRLDPVRNQVEVIFADETIAVTLAAIRALETGHPPAYYLPPDAVFPGAVAPNGRTTWCEFKGVASYLDVTWKGQTAAGGAWTYLDPSPGYGAIAGYVAFYPALMDVCLVDLEPVSPQPGGFYGGWITSGVVGPFKGEPGSERW